jgi:hypothetical protein
MHNTTLSTTPISTSTITIKTEVPPEMKKLGEEFLIGGIVIMGTIAVANIYGAYYFFDFLNPYLSLNK